MKCIDHNEIKNDDSDKEMDVLASKLQGKDRQIVEKVARKLREYSECVDALRLEVERMNDCNVQLQKKVDYFEITGKVGNEIDDLELRDHGLVQMKQLKEINALKKENSALQCQVDIFDRKFYDRDMDALVEDIFSPGKDKQPRPKRPRMCSNHSATSSVVSSINWFGAFQHCRL